MQEQAACKVITGDAMRSEMALVGGDRPTGKRRSPVNPLPGYVSLYNAHVRDFFGQSASATLQPLMVSSDSISEYRSDHTPGTWWTSNEKQQFFRLLGRYSIHNVDMIHAGIGTKSELEILSYYHLLKAALNDLRRKLEIVNYKVVVPRRKNPHNFRIHKKVRGLLLYRDMPIAYEMSEAFTSIEDRQAIILSQRERKKVNDENRRFQRLFDAWNHAQDGESDDVHDDTDLSIVDARAAMFISRRTARQKGELAAPKLHYKSYALLEELARLFTRRLILDVAAKKLLSRWISTRNPENPSSVTKSDIDRTLESWGKLLSTAFFPEAGEQKALAIPHVEQLQLDGQIQQTRWEETIEEQLNILADSDIDVDDQWNSRGHEHVLLTYLSTSGRDTTDITAENEILEEEATEGTALDVAEVPVSYSDSSAASDVYSSDSDCSIIDDDYYEIPNQLIFDTSETCARYL